MTRRITVRGIVLRDGKLLCVRLKARKNNMERDNSYWCLPGGGLEDGESLFAGIEREMIEETAVKPVIGNLLYMQQFMYGDVDFLEFFFHITNSEDYANIDLSKSTHGPLEIEEIDFVDPATAYILPEFLTTELLHEHAASNGSVKIISKF